ncbi:VTT domain-containing protein [Pseudonocardia phyllosphaerae]|uniref:VTT domain-containing protein n=1 Tax=Pseudonocardia phyllosphaerae TaxID=3390502 RepID=UPI003979DD4A
MDPLAIAAGVLHSAWLLPALVLMIAVDGPAPVLPTETILLSGIASATVVRDVPMLIGLYLAAVTGAVLGDLLLYGLGRGSHRLLPRKATEDSNGVARWVRSNLFARPVTVLVAARFVPAGRLVGGVASGRLGLPMRSFLAGTGTSAALWGLYLLGVGLLLGPVTDGNPLLCVLAGGVMAVLASGAFAVGRKVHQLWTSRRRRDAPVVELPMALSRGAARDDAA